tara:strand:- start:677 stop:2185 length:1509 start_codon:yes stop_codon:yes gene_type:complete
VYKLAGLDAGFLYNETPRSPQHIASVQVLELPDGVDTARFVADLKQLLLDRIHLVSYFTNKLQFVPFQLDHPVWVRDADFDIDRHVLQAEVASPGGRAEFEAKIAELHAQPLDRSKPLWELWVLTGLEGGRIAYYNRVHHACLDGVSGQAAIEAIMDVTPEPRTVAPPPADFWRRPSRFDALSLLSGAFENLAKFQVRQASAVLGHAETARRLWQRAVDGTRGLGAVVEGAPVTRFNRAVDRDRTFVTGELPLADVRRIGKATGTSVNDVFLAICAGALRRYLARRADLPERALIAGCPVSLRKPGDTTSNNQVTMMLVSLATEEADPVKRLLKIGRSSIQAKGFVSDVSGSYDADVALPGMPALFSGAMRWMEGSDIVDVAPPRLPCNVLVSNVPGPRAQLYSLGAKVLTHYPVSIPAHGQGLNITVQSYAGQMYFGVTACARALPDGDVLRNDLLAAFLELKACTLQAPRAVPAVERDVEVPLPPLGDRADALEAPSEAA